MRRCAWLLALFVSLWTVAPAVAQMKLKIATEGAYPPFNYVDASGKPGGFDVDIAGALCAVMDAECEVVVEPWDTILDGLRDRRYDVIIASMSQTPERDKAADFTDFYYRARSIFLGRKELAESYQAKSNFAGLRIGVAKGTTQSAYVLRKYSATAKVVEYENTDVVSQKLIAGEIDLKLDDTLTGFTFLKSPEGKGFDFVGEPLDQEALPSEARIAVREGDDALRDAFNKAIQSIRLNGEYDRINRKYFPFSIY